MFSSGSILDLLPPELSFLSPCVREMLKLRKGYRAPVNATENPEQALEAEIEHFITRDRQIMGRWLRQKFPDCNSEEFSQRSMSLLWSLNEWLSSKTSRCRHDDQELKMLYGVIGLLMNPVPYLKPRKRRRNL